MELNFYTRPFRQAKYGSWVYDAKGNFIFQFDEENEFDDKGNYTFGIKEFRQRVIQSLNCLNHEFIDNCEFTINSNSEIEILKDGKLFITIRGWGNLTGIGGFNFPAEKASKIQDDLRDWIIYKLNKKQ